MVFFCLLLASLQPALGEGRPGRLSLRQSVQVLTAFAMGQAFQECGLWCLKPALPLCDCLSHWRCFLAGETGPHYNLDRGGGAGGYPSSGLEIADLKENNTESELIL